MSINYVVREVLIHCVEFNEIQKTYSNRISPDILGFSEL